MMKASFLTVSFILVAMSISLIQPTDLPPRPTPEPIHGSAPLVGGSIELRVEGMLAPLWTEVQWQDNNGEWHTVVGWRGTIEVDQHQQWWVGKENLGEQSFRWLLHSEPDGTLLATSEIFDLPAQNRQRVIVTVELLE